MKVSFTDRHQYLRYMIKLKRKYSFRQLAKDKFYNCFLDRSDTKILWMDKLKDNQNEMLNKMFNFLQQIYYEAAYFNNNQGHSFLKNVSVISFPMLKELHLFSSNIQSIELLQGINAPLLQQLLLRNNKINNLKSLRKCNMNQIRILSLSGNYINELIDLSQIKGKNLQIIGIDFFLNLPLQDLSIDWIFRLQSQKIQQLYLRKRKKIQKCESLCYKKYCNFKSFDGAF